MTLCQPTPFFLYPNGIVAWIWAVFLFIVVLALNWRWRKYNRRLNVAGWLFFVILAVAVPFVSLNFGSRITPLTAFPPSGLAENTQIPAVLFLASLPWFLAAGFMGPAAATMLAVGVGFCMGFCDTHSVFTPLELALAAAFLGAALRQPYRTLEFRLLRSPIFMAVFLSVIYPLFYIINQIIGSNVPFTVKNVVDIFFSSASRALYASLAFAIPLGIAALLGLAAAAFLPKLWGGRLERKPSPAETSLEIRFFYTLGPLLLIIVVSLMAGLWMITQQVSRKMLLERMEGSATIAAEAVPFFVQVGQDLVFQMAEDSSIASAFSAKEIDKQALSQVLMDNLSTVPFFHQLILLDKNGQVIVWYPQRAGEEVSMAQIESNALGLALNGLPVQSYSIPQSPDGRPAQMSFIASVRGADGSVQGVLVARSEIGTNPFLQPAVTSIQGMQDLGGEGFLLDENGDILLYGGKATNPPVMPGPIPDDINQIYDRTNEDGGRVLAYYKPAVGRAWWIALTVPSTYVENMTINMALPFSAVLLAGVALTLMLVQYSMKRVTHSLKTFAAQADYISTGRLDTGSFNLALTGDDANEIGRLKRSFEKMRVSLKTRLDELNQLLIISQNVGATLKIDEALQPILEAGLVGGASAARIVLDEFDLDGADGQSGLARSYGAGQAADQYAYLDSQILDLTLEQDLIILSNAPRASLLRYEAVPGGAVVAPQGIVAVALRHKNLYHGSFWVAFHQPRQITIDDPDVRFIITLAGQAAAAVSNVRLFLNAEIGRQRLEAILASTPDPVLVTDDQNRLLLVNPAARQVLGETLPLPRSAAFLGGDAVPVQDALTHEDLLALLQAPSDEDRSLELQMSDERSYLATVSSIMAREQRIGRVCVMQDVTRFKQLDTLKSDFVSTVSHDLRSPLTLIQGYVTMLEMVGELNEQQTGYLRKVSASIEHMGHLINNLLDLGRLEAGVALQIEALPLREFIEGIVSAFQLQATQKRVTLTCDTSRLGGVKTIEADSALLRQAVQNLVENAVKYTEPEGKVDVVAEARADTVIVSVTDTGIGIAPVDQVRLFEKFYRGGRGQTGSLRRGRSEDGHGGTGLGLAIVKSIVERHHGKVNVDSQLGKGSLFTVTLPIQQPTRKRI